MSRIDYVIENILDILIELNGRQDFLEKTLIDLVGRVTHENLSEETFERAQDIFDSRIAAIKKANKKNDKSDGLNDTGHSDEILNIHQTDDLKPDDVVLTEFPFPKAENTVFKTPDWSPNDGDIK